MTVTVCIDRNVNWRPGRYVNRWGNRLRSVRCWWLWFAIAWYRFDDHQLVVEPHNWEQG
jgi:hypothetical protein